MKKFVIIMLVLLNLKSFCQKEELKPFTLIVIKPDTAIVDKSLYDDRDSIEFAHLKSYYQCTPGIDFKKDFQTSTDWIKIKSIIEIPSSNLPEYVKHYKFYYLLSEYSSQIYNFYFPENKSHPTIEFPNHLTDINSLKDLADSMKADYIVFFENIYTILENGLPLLKLTTCVYSKEEQRIILKKQTEGNTINMGALTNLDESNVMWTCNTNVKLSCLLTNGVRTSTHEVMELLKKRQFHQ